MNVRELHRQLGFAIMAGNGEHEVLSSVDSTSALPFGRIIYREKGLLPPRSVLIGNDNWALRVFGSYYVLV